MGVVRAVGRVSARGRLRAARAVERFDDRFEAEAQEVGRDADGRDAPLAREAAHGRFAHLKNRGELSRGQKLGPRAVRTVLVTFHVRVPQPSEMKAYCSLDCSFAAGVSVSATRKTAAPSISTSCTAVRIPSARTVTR